MTGSLTLCQGHRSPSFMDQRSPQGRRSPNFLTHDRLRSPNELPIGGHFDMKSPTMEKLSPTGRRSPTFSIHTQDRRSPVGMLEIRSRSPTSTVHVQDGRCYEQDHTPDDHTARTPTDMQSKRTSIGLFTPMQFGEKRSPVSALPIPPITVSNPTETCKLVARMAESTTPDFHPPDFDKSHPSHHHPPEPEKEVTEKKEKTSVMKEILAFVRKPSKKVTTRTGRFAAAFSRAESSSTGPLIRQSTFSSSPAAASTAAKSAITKQMSEVGFEPKMSLKFSINTKMSLKLRRSAANDDKKKDKKPTSGDEASGTESDPRIDQVGKATTSTISEVPFELANVHFEKVGESYIKHEQIREEPSEEGSPIQIVAMSNENAQIDTTTGNIVDIKHEHDKIDETDETNDNIEKLLTELKEHIKIKPEPIYANLVELRGLSVEQQPQQQDQQQQQQDQSSSSTAPLQCPTFEIEPPSRRSSFDPPRSPFLENLRSPGVDTDTELMNLNRLDSGGDSFEIVDGDRNRESSFEDRYSSRDTSFDISRYQSTSYEDQTSSFEIVDIDGKNEQEKKSNIDLRKSSIELVDPETFQRSGSSARKSSLETHFDYNPFDTTSSRPGFPMTKKQKPDHFRSRDLHISPFSGVSRARSPLSNQTSSNYSSRDSYDSSSSYPHSHYDQKSPYADPSKMHFPLTVKGNDEVRTFLCTDKRCASIFEPRSSSSYLGQGTSSGSEFEPPSPRRAASASPKHTFTFRIVLKKVDSSPDAICPSAERRSRDRLERHKRRDSRRKRLADAGKSF